MKLIVGLFALLPFYLHAQVTFIDVASEQNINWKGKTFGASWADVTGNGYPDLFMQCHSNFFDPYFDDDIPRYYFNQDGEFVEGPLIDMIAETDWHGGMMFDYDNDGDLDHLSTTGGSSGNIFLENEDGVFIYENRAVDAGIDCQNCVGRSAGLIDADNDGFLDILLSNLEEGQDGGGPILFINEQDQTFTDRSAEYNMDWDGATFAVCADLTGAGDLNVIYLSGRPFITTLTEDGFQTEGDIPLANTNDFCVVDFNGDLMPDIFAVKAIRAIAVEQITPNLIRGHVPFSANSETIEINISANDENPQLTIYPRTISTSYIIVSGNETVQSVVGVETLVELDQFSDEFAGVPAIEDTLTLPHIYVGYDETEAHWTIRFKSGTFRSPFGIEFVGDDSEVTGYSGFDIPEHLGDRMYLNQGGLDFSSVLANLFENTDNSVSVTAADFDNDMDVDLYVVRTSYAGNKENILYENVDNQFLIRHEGAWGAVGDGPGIGETVNSVDFNNDGFMDLFVTNGASVFFLDSARVNLYENQGNDNNWIKIVLNGIISNPLGLHSKVYAYAGGVVQMRYQNGGFHNFSQDDSRLHFGLAQNDIVDSIVVDWPSGIHQVITDVEVNQILTIDEGFNVSTDNEYPADSFMKLFPNPTTGEFSVRAAANIEGINVYNSLGVRVHAEQYQGRRDTRKIRILNQPPGMYTVEVVSEKGIFRSKVLLIGR